MSPVRDQHGLAAPVTVALAAVLVVVTLLGAALGRLLVDQRRVSAAADLAALAGASAVQRGEDGCRAARQVAAANGTAVAACTVSGQHVRLESRLSSPTLLHRVVSLRATADAGPRR